MLVAILGTLGVVGVCVAVGMWVDRRVTIVPRAEDLDEASRPKPLGSVHAAGMAARSALRSDPERMRRVLERQRCTCAAHPVLVTAGTDEVRYDQRTLHVERLRCPACDAARSLYFDLR